MGRIDWVGCRKRCHAQEEALRDAMNENERWMTIATSAKREKRFSIVKMNGSRARMKAEIQMQVSSIKHWSDRHCYSILLGSAKEAR